MLMSMRLVMGVYAAWSTLTGSDNVITAPRLVPVREHVRLPSALQTRSEPCLRWTLTGKVMSTPGRDASRNKMCRESAIG